MSKNNMRNSLRSKLSSSLKEEEKKVQSRFETAENLLLRSTGVSQAIRSPQSEETTAIQAVPGTPSQKKIRIKVVTFKIPEEEDSVLDTLVLQAAREGKLVNRSQVLRAGLVALSRGKTEDLLSFIDSLTEIKPGRPVH